MKRGVWIVLGLALIWITVNLPAGLIRFLIDEQKIAVVAPQGTLWNGSATLVSELGLQAQCHWRTSFFQSDNLGPSLTLHATHDTSDLRAKARIGFYTAEITIGGKISASSLQPLLGRYDLFLTGDFEIADSTWRLQRNGVQLAGPTTLRWNGGAVRYILANKLYTATMPPLDARVSSADPEQLHAAIFFAGEAPKATDQPVEQAPLLLMRLMLEGSVYIGVSRGMLRLANFPWQGDEADGVLIFEIERSL